PTARAAASAVDVPRGNSSSLASTPCARNTAATRSTGSGHLSTRCEDNRNLRRGFTVLPNAPTPTQRETNDDRIGCSEGADRSALQRRERTDRGDLRRVRRRNDRVLLRVLRPELRSPHRGDARRIRG